MLDLSGGGSVATDDGSTRSGKRSTKRAASSSRSSTMRKSSSNVKKDMDKKKADDDDGLSEAAKEAKAKLLEPSYFVDFLRDDIYDEDGVMVAEAPKIYELGESMASLTDRANMFLEKFNEEMPGKRMDLILFKDAMKHLMRVSRIVGTPRGNLLFVGVGGSGKQSLTR